MLRRSLFPLLAVFLCWICPSELFGKGGEWPDGSAVESWYTRSPKELRGKQARRFSILDYGAVSGSDAVQTAAIQRAIDAAASSGGGTVVIPEGSFRSGALFFKPRTHLYLEEGAVLLGSRDIRDYPLSEVHIEGVLQPYPAALINAYGTDGFSIRGRGTVNGDGKPFWQEFWATRKRNPHCTNLEVRRPRMLYVSGAENILLEGVRFENSGFWTLHLYKCSHIRLKDAVVSAPMKPLRAPSSDAVDLDGCTDVHITGCHLEAGDDLIAVKGGKGPHADTDPDNPRNERILIENCSFGHGPGVLVFGSECVGAKNVILRDSKVEGAERLVWLKMRPDTPQRYSHILVENVSGEVKYILYVKPWTQFFDLKGEKEIPRSYASSVQIRNCTLKCRQARYVIPAPDQYTLENVTLEKRRYKFSYNKKEDRVKPYKLEDPLVFADGGKVDSPDLWPVRRAEILEIFQREMYGRIPPASKVYPEVLERGTTLGGAAERIQVRMWFSPDKTGPKVDWLLVRPLRSVPSPVILALNFYGNHTVLPDEQVLMPDYPMEGDLMDRGAMNDTTRRSFFPVKEFIDRGYAFVTACYADVSPDPENPADEALAYTRIFDLWGARDELCTDQTTSLSAWAWALMRGADLIASLPELDASRILLTGSSRLGKAALLAGAYDQRFAVVAPNQTGGGGAPLSKRDFGETIASEINNFPHWFCRAYEKYAGAEQTMPFDQHLLLSCVAPRPLLIEGFNNPWFDTRGEFLSLKAASPVWEFLGVQGLPAVEWPDSYDTSAIGSVIGYVRRDGQHGLETPDWKWMLDFADRHFRP